MKYCSAQQTLQYYICKQVCFLQKITKPGVRQHDRTSGVRGLGQVFAPRWWNDGGGLVEPGGTGNTDEIDLVLP